MPDFLALLLSHRATFFLKAKASFGNSFMRRLLGVLSVDVLARASSVLLIPVFLRLMPQYQFGLFGYVFAFVSSIAMIANFGLYVAQVKLVSQESEASLGDIVFTIHMLLLGLLAAAFSLIYSFGLDLMIVERYLKLDIDFSSYRIFIGILVLSYVLSVMQKTYFMAVQDIAMLQISNVARIFVCNGAVIAALAASTSDQSLVRIKATALSEAVVCVIFGYFVVRKMHRNFRPDIAKKSLKIAIPVMLGAVLSLIYMLSDKVVLEKYIGFEQLATYNLAATVASIIPLVISSFQTIYSPMFFKEAEFCLKKSKRVLATLAVAFLAMAVGIELVLLLSLAWGIVPAKYQAVLWISPFLLLAAVLQALTQVLGNYFILVERTSLNLLIGVGSTALTVCLNLIFIPRFQTVAAAGSGVIAGAVALAATYIAIVKAERRRQKSASLQALVN